MTHKRIDQAEWPVSPARKRRLKKRGSTCRWNPELGSWVWRNPMTIHKVYVDGELVGTTWGGLRINAKAPRLTKHQRLIGLLKAAHERRWTFTCTI